MCSGDKMLPALKRIRSQKKTLRCTVNSSCWCMQVQARFTHDDDKQDCLSPSEMLKQTSVLLSDRDREYLETLVDREFILHGNVS